MKILEDLPILKQTPLFSGLDEDELVCALNCLQARLLTFEKGEAVLLAGGPAAEVGVVLRGRVQVVREGFLGDRNLLVEIPPAGLFAEAFSCAGLEFLPVSVFAAQDCSVLMLDYRRIVTTCSNACAFHTRLISNMLGILAAKTVFLNQRVELLSKRTTREKLWHYLLGEAERSGSMSFAIPYNRQELADYLCVERSAMSAELSRMRREGLLEFDRSKFFLSRIQSEKMGK